MTSPDDFAAILAARTPGRWRDNFCQDAECPQDDHHDIYADAGPDDGFGTSVVDIPGSHLGAAQDAAAIVAAVNLAPLLLDLWRANVEMLDDWDHRGTEAAVWVLHQKVRHALAALEAAE